LGTYERETTGARSCCTVHDPGTTKLLPSTQLPLPILINCSLRLFLSFYQLMFSFRLSISTLAVFLFPLDVLRLLYYFTV
jgi:hypothetical protein